MTKQIRKIAPEGTEYFWVTRDQNIFYRVDEEDRVYIWAKNEWHLSPCLSLEDLQLDPNIHHIDGNGYFWVFIAVLTMLIGVLLW